MQVARMRLVSVAEWPLQMPSFARSVRAHDLAHGRPRVRCQRCTFLHRLRPALPAAISDAPALMFSAPARTRETVSTKSFCIANRYAGAAKADCLIQVRVALVSKELDAMTNGQFP